MIVSYHCSLPLKDLTSDFTFYVNSLHTGYEHANVPLKDVVNQ